MKAPDRDLLREMETPIFDVRDWGEAVQLAACGLPDEEQRAALQILGYNIAVLGDDLRKRWRLATGMDRHLT